MIRIDLPNFYCPVPEVSTRIQPEGASSGCARVTVAAPPQLHHFQLPVYWKCGPNCEQVESKFQIRLHLREETNALSGAPIGDRSIALLSQA